MVTDAVVYHRELSARQVRKTPATGGHPRMLDRRSALYVFAVNLPFWPMLVTLAGVHADSVSMFFVGTSAAGIGFGSAFQGALRSVLPLAEPHEGVHAIDVLLHGFGVARRPYHVRIGGAVEQMPFAVMNAPQQPIEQREPVRRCVTQDVRHQFVERARHANRDAFTFWQRIK